MEMAPFVFLCLLAVRLRAMRKMAVYMLCCAKHNHTFLYISSYHLSFLSNPSPLPYYFKVSIPRKAPRLLQKYIVQLDLI